jgi:hypothetical protein
VTELVERYRRYAEKCLHLIQNFSDPEAKRSLLAVANAWLMLAAQREKTLEATSPGESPVPVNEPPPAEPPPPPPPIDDPPKPPIKEPPPRIEPPQRLDATRPDGSMQS